LPVEKLERLVLQQRVAAIGGEDPSPISVGQMLTGRSPRRA
jgi:hypothetical protein